MFEPTKKQFPYLGTAFFISPQTISPAEVVSRLSIPYSIAFQRFYK